MSTFTGCGKLSLSIVVSVAALPENVFLIARGPSCSIPQVIQMEVCLWLFDTFEGFLESWLDFPQISLDTMSCLLIMKGLLLEMYFHFRWFCSLRGFTFIEYSSCEFLCCWTISHIQTMAFKNEKLMSVLKFRKCIFSKNRIYKNVNLTQGLL